MRSLRIATAFIVAALVSNWLTAPSRAGGPPNKSSGVQHARDRAASPDTESTAPTLGIRKLADVPTQKPDAVHAVR